jgi:hypothetical protein
MPGNPIGRNDLVNLVQALTTGQLNVNESHLLMALLALAGDRIGTPARGSRVDPPALVRGRLVVNVGNQVPALNQLFGEPVPGAIPGEEEEPEPDEITVTLGITRSSPPPDNPPEPRPSPGEPTA